MSKRLNVYFREVREELCVEFSEDVTEIDVVKLQNEFENILKELKGEEFVRLVRNFDLLDYEENEDREEILLDMPVFLYAKDDIYRKPNIDETVYVDDSWNLQGFITLVLKENDKELIEKFIRMLGYEVELDIEKIEKLFSNPEEVYNIEL